MCGTGIVYSANINDRPTTFGTSGMLFRSNKVMYDRETNTLWNQFQGVPIVGELVGSGIKLKILPVSLTTWEEWLGDHPDTRVLSLETEFYSPSQYEPETDEKSSYFGYRNNPEPIFPVLGQDDRLDAKEQVLGLNIDGVHAAYPISVTSDSQMVNDVVNGVPLVILGSAKSAEARAYQSEDTEFSLAEDVGDGFPKALVYQNSERWVVTPDALVKESDTSETRPAIPSSVSYWFGWSGFHANTSLYSP